MNELAINIVLIDDNDIDTSVNEKLIKLANITHNIKAFNSAKLAISYLRDQSELYTGGIVVVLLDILMPEMNGFECLKKLDALSTEAKERICVYMLSSSIDRLDIMKADAEPMVRKVLEKPLDVYLLKKIIFDLKQEFA